MPTYSNYYFDIDPLSSPPPLGHPWYSDLERQMHDTNMAQALTFATKPNGAVDMDDLYTAYIAREQLSEAQNIDGPPQTHQYFQQAADEFFASNSGMKYPEPPAEPTFWNTMYDALYGDKPNTVHQAPWLPNEEVFPYTSY